MAIRITEVNISTEYDGENNIRPTANVGQQLYLSVSVTENNWLSVKNINSSWNDIKTKFNSWLDLKNI
jgi:hypothetical protein